MRFVFKLAVAVVLVSVVCSTEEDDEKILKAESLKAEKSKTLSPDGKKVASATKSYTSDYVIYDLNQGHCREVVEGPTHDCRWPAGLYPFVDWLARGGRIVAYQIRWFNGHWSGWFVPGVNDIDIKFNPYYRPCSLPTPAGSMRRWWSYFYDHTHRYIICYN